MAEAKKTVKKTKKEEVAEEVIAPEVTEVVATETKKAPAKAGKRSEKSLKEADEKVAKEERKEETKKADSEKAEAPKQPVKTTTILERRAKGYRKSAEQIEVGKTYTLKEALEIATKTSHVKFDATVELHVRLGVDPRQADQNLRDMVMLPAGTGKTVRVAVFADPEGVAAAKKAGADVAGSEEFLQQLDKGTIDFDILISTPMNMAKLGKYARLLGPKGLMPNPKSGTVTTDITKAVTEAKAGRVEYRVDSTGIVHTGVGKVSFGTAKLLQNVQAIGGSIKANKPGSLKGNYILSVYITTSMGPSIQVANSEL